MEFKCRERRDPQDAHSGPVRPLAAFSVTNYRRFVIGQSVSLVGSWTETVAQALRLADVRRRTLGDDSLVRGRLVYPERIQIDEALFSLG